MAKGFRPVDRDQQFLMAPDMRDWLPAGHLVWFVLDAVAQLDLDAFRARHPLGGVGRRAYDPEMLLALLIYAYAVGERSSRQIQRLCGTDVAFRVICAQDVPDHTTIARFRQSHVEAFDDVFAQVLRLCARAGMGRLATVAIDGTKIAANASIEAGHDADWFRAQAGRIVEEAAAVDAAEDDEFGPGVRGDELPAELADPRTRAARIRQCLAELEAEQAARDAEAEQARVKAQEHLRELVLRPVTGRDPAGVDPVAAARARVERELAVRQGEIEADAALVARARAEGRRGLRGRRVTDPFAGKRMRKALLALQKALATAAAKDAKDAKDAKTKVGQRNLTDPDSRIMPTRKGWVQGYNAQFGVSADWLILALTLTDNPADTEELVPMLERVGQAAELVNGEREDPEELGVVLADAGYCSEGNLTAEGPDRLIATGKGHKVRQEARDDPAEGPPPEEATPIEAMRHRLRTPRGAALYRKRGATVEPVNGHVKDRIGLRTFSMRGMTACLGELNLAAAVHNLRRMFVVGGARTA